MVDFRLLAAAGVNQVRRLGRILKGGPVDSPSFAGMTVDADDVRIARSWLKDPSGDDCTPLSVTAAFELAFANWNGSRSAAAFAAGRFALTACLAALDLQPGAEVVVPGYTCIAVPNAVRFAGLEPVFADIELDTYGLDVDSLESRITPRTRAIVLHHLYGLVCRDYEKILDIAARHGIKVIEDCAHAMGASCRGVKVGNRGDMAFFSTEGTKVISTVQGGIAVTNDDRLAARLKQFAESAPVPDAAFVASRLRYQVHAFYTLKHRLRWLFADFLPAFCASPIIDSVTPAELEGRRPADYGARMPDALAALGLNQLRKLDAYNELRRRAGARWAAWCDARSFSKAFVRPDSVPIFLRYPVMVEPSMKRDHTWVFKELGLWPGVWFTGQLHPIAIDLPECPNAATAVAGVINLQCLR